MVEPMFIYCDVSLFSPSFAMRRYFWSSSRRCTSLSSSAGVFANLLPVKCHDQKPTLRSLGTMSIKIVLVHALAGLEAARKLS